VRWIHKFYVNDTEYACILYKHLYYSNVAFKKIDIIRDNDIHNQRIKF